MQEQFFHGQQHNEEIICFFRKHWISTLPYLLFMGAFIFLSVIYFVKMEDIYSVVPHGLFKILFLLTAVLALTFIHYFFLKIVQHFFTLFIVTNARIIAMSKTLFIIDDKEAFDLRMIQEINKHQNGLLPNILQYGDISITLSQSSAILRLTRVSNPEHCFRTINKAKNDHIENRIRMKFAMQEGYRNKPDEHPIPQD